MSKGNKKFLEILDRHGISAYLETMTVAMHRAVSGGKETVGFYGVGQPISAEIVKEINEEVIPLLQAEQAAGWKYEYEISSEVLEMGAPASRQAGWNEHCKLFNMNT